jgi:hypothetical protein
MSGFYKGSDLVDKTFYGFRLNDRTGHLDVEVINDGETPVVLPQDGFIDPEDYKQWVWSQDTLKFKFLDNGHLLIRML